MITLHNQFVSASINPYGAELKSLINKENNTEYIWQADPTYWNRSAPVLFPIVGEVKNNTIIVGGEQYALNRHGFARDSMFTVAKQTEDSVTFTLESTAETKKIFPFEFRFSVQYTLEGKKIHVYFITENIGADTMFFSVGAHPAFNLPTSNITDYYIEFEKPETLSRYLLADNLFSGETEVVLKNSNRMELQTLLFDKDAIVFKNMQSGWMALKSKSGDYSVKMDLEGFPYFGIWTKPNCEQFICLEPWCGLADSSNFNGEFKDKEGVISLASGEVFERVFTIDINN